MPTTIFLVALFTPDSLISTLIGGLVSLGIISWLKGQTGLYGVGAFVLSIVISFVVAGIALAASAYLSGTPVTLEWVIQNGAQIFVLATAAYKFGWSDKAPVK